MCPVYSKRKLAKALIGGLSLATAISDGYITLNDEFYEKSGGILTDSDHYMKLLKA